MAIMLSVRPEWVEKILNGEKTIEIRKSIPKCPLPVKVYIYCTKGKTNQELAFHETIQKYKIYPINNSDILNGKVVAEFTLKEYDFYKMPMDITKEFEEKSCINGTELMKYLDGNFFKSFYAWHIDDLKIYDKPKELSEFGRKCADKDWGTINSLGCWESGCTLYEIGECHNGFLQLTRPPQSWCYCEELEE